MPTESELVAPGGPSEKFTPAISMEDQDGGELRTLDLSTPDGRSKIADATPVDERDGIRPEVISILQEGGEELAAGLIKDLSRSFETMRGETSDSKYITALNVAAGKENIHDLIALSLYDEARFHSDRILAPVERLADSSNIDDIERALTREEERHVVGDYLDRITFHVRVLYAIAHREPKVAPRCEKIIRDLAGRLNRTSPTPRTSGLTPDTLRRMKEDTAPELIRQRHERIFDPPEDEGDFWTEDVYQILEQDSTYNQGTGERLDALRNLRQLQVFDQEHITVGSDVYDRRIERLAYLEEGTSPYLPTLGIEVEVFHRSIMPAEAEGWSKEKCEAYRVEMMQKYLATNEAGIPHGKDAAWEFALAPAADYRTLSRETSELIALGLINAEYGKSPLHITIGGVTVEGEKGREALLMSRALEATGWSTTGGRLKKPVLTGRSGWLVKGKEGVRERKTPDGEPVGVEFRTMQLQSLNGLDRTLRSAHLLGAALKAYQGEDQTPIGQELRGVWTEFRGEIAEIFGQHGLSNPAESPWTAEARTGERQEGEERINLGEEFLRLADLLDEARRTPDSEGGQFVEQVQSAIIKARGRVNNILEPQVTTA